MRRSHCKGCNCWKFQETKGEREGQMHAGGLPQAGSGKNGCCAVHSKLMFPHEPLWKTLTTLTYAQKCSIVPVCTNVGCTNNVWTVGGYRKSVCKTHSGQGRTKCFHDGCLTPAVSGGQVGLCRTHGGGKRCQYTQCGKSAQGNSGYCVGHGGGKRCQIEGCTSSARNTTEFCTKHRSGEVLRTE